MTKTYANILTGHNKICIIYLYYEKRNKQRETTQPYKIFYVASADLDTFKSIDSFSSPLKKLQLNVKKHLTWLSKLCIIDV